MTGARPPEAHRRSWVDALMAAIERLPGPLWPYFVLATLVLLAGNVGFRLLDGPGAVAGINVPTLIFPALTFYGLAASFYINRAAHRALLEFRPALGELESEYPALERRLTTASFSGSLVAIVLSAESKREGWFPPRADGASASIRRPRRTFSRSCRDCYSAPSC